MEQLKLDAYGEVQFEVNVRKMKRAEIAKEIREVRNEKFFGNRLDLERKYIAKLLSSAPLKPTAKNLQLDVDEHRAIVENWELPEGLPCGADDAEIERHEFVVLLLKAWEDLVSELRGQPVKASAV